MKKLRLTDDAFKHHEELFPNHESKLQKTDPEFIELFDNWAFDEVIGQSKFDTKTRVMMILASTIASQALGEYKVMVGAALNVNLTPVEIKEILYQAVPYVGIAKVFDFLHATNEVLQNKGIDLPLEGQATTTPETRYEKGLALQKAIFGEMIDEMREQSPKDQRHIQDFLVANCFGDYYTRNGLDIKTRELLDVCHANLARRLRASSQGTCGRESQGRQRPRAPRQCCHPATAIHRVSSNP